MKKHIINKIGFVPLQRLLSAAVVIALTATIETSCSDDDDDQILSPVQPQTELSSEQYTSDIETPAQTFTLSIPATIEGSGSLSKKVTLGGTDAAPAATGTFETSEKIYVFNVTKNAFVSDDYHYLQPSDISEDGKSCTLTGSFTGTIEAGDQITLLYNLNAFYKSYPGSCVFRSDENDLFDGGIAKNLTVTSTDNGKLTTESPAVIQLCQSIFRFKFVDENDNAITVKTLVIESSAAAKYYYPLKTSSPYLVHQPTWTFNTPTSDYINISIIIDESNGTNPFAFKVTDDANNVYEGDKSAPSGGFLNGKYYYNASPIQLTKTSSLVEPTITWGEGTEEETLDEYNKYDVYGPWDDVNKKYLPSTLTISGTSDGCRFYMDWGSTTTLSNLTANRNDNNFIYSAGDLNLIINGTNTITCKDYLQTISVDGILKISGSGTLTVTAKDKDRKGLFADKYNDGSNYAADGYTVSISEMTDNGDGTYTWTYTVTNDN